LSTRGLRADPQGRASRSGLRPQYEGAQQQPDRARLEGLQDKAESDRRDFIQADKAPKGLGQFCRAPASGCETRVDVQK
jgi:hypothetical protein